MIYRAVVRPILYKIDPEVSHDVALALLETAGPPWARLRKPTQDPRL